MEDIAVAVPDNLNLDVFSPSNIPLQENRIIAESAPCFLAGLLKLLGEIGRGVDHPHAAAATAKGGFDDERESDLSCDLLRFRAIGRNRILRAGHDRNSCRLGNL